MPQLQLMVSMISDDSQSRQSHQPWCQLLLFSSAVYLWHFPPLVSDSQRDEERV
jgi:cytochrome c oxidase assembly factor CtaG